MDLQGTSSTKLDELGVPRRDDCLYAACYCEENIWQLCKAIKDGDEAKLAQFLVVFISNRSKTIPLWHQKAGKGDDGVVMWDYHVILLRSMDAACTSCLVYDLDTTLPFPCPFSEYFPRAIRPDNNFKRAFQRKFRLTPASEYLVHFSSDRSHMRKENGDWFRPPPPWPCIHNSQHPNSIVDFWSMDDGSTNFLSDISEVLNTVQLLKKFGR